MLRECRRVLEPGGRLAVATIEIADGLGPMGRARALELGPADVDAEASLRELVRRAGFEILAERDVTPDFRRTLVRRLGARSAQQAGAQARRR